MHLGSNQRRVNEAFAIHKICSIKRITSFFCEHQIERSLSSIDDSVTSLTMIIIVLIVTIFIVQRQFPLLQSSLQNQREGLVPVTFLTRYKEMKERWLTPDYE